jgi:hypothetical protein
MYDRATSSPSSCFPARLIVHHFAADPCVDTFDVFFLAFTSSMCLLAQLHFRICSTLWKFPWRLLGLADSRNSERQKQDIFDDFMAALLCDLDATFGRPLRMLGLSRAALGEKIVGVLEVVGRIAQGTNMGLERLLALIKSSCPMVNRRKPTAERLYGCGTLTQVMHRHLKTGNADFRGRMRRAKLLQLGVPIRAKTKLNKKRRRVEAWHFRYGNAKINAEKFLNQDMSHEEASRRRSVLAKEWATLSSIDQASFQAEYLMNTTAAENAKADSDACSDDSIASIEFQRSVWQGYIGNETLPVKPDLLENVLDSYAASDVGHGYHVATGGVRNKARCLRRDNLEKLLIKDQGQIPLTKQILNDSSCVVLHPGLCVNDDEEIYEASLTIAAAICRYYTKDLAGFFYQFVGYVSEAHLLPDGSRAMGPLQAREVYKESVYFATSRRKSTKIRVSHCFVRCLLAPQSLLGDNSIAIALVARHLEPRDLVRVSFVS